MKLYSIYDRITHQYGTPILAVNDDDCKRRVSLAYKDNPMLGDLDLYFLANFSVDLGWLSPFDSTHLTGPEGCEVFVPHFICPLFELYEVNSNGEK